MAKQQILLVDADAAQARLLEVSLRSAGFTVAVSSSAESALAKLEHGVPDLILTDTRLPGADGFAFVQKLRARPEHAEVPVVFLTEQGALDDKLRGLELGVDDYLAKPIMVREVVTRVQLLLSRKRQQRIAVEPQARTRFSGSLEDVAVVDLLQTIAVSGKSGVASVKRGEREAWLYFDRGQIIDAEVGDLEGEEAVYRTLTWTTGSFDLEFRAIDRPRVIEVSSQALLMEGLRRVDELGRIAEQLPPEHAVVDIDHEALASRLHEIPDELNGILRLIDGKRTLVDLIDASPFDDLSTLTVLSKFYFEGLLRNANPEPVEWAPGSRPVGAALRHSVPPSNDALASTRLPPSSSSELRSSPAASSRFEPSALPTSVAANDPPRESQRLTPAPARAPFDPDAKLMPKGIVNVGDSTPPPSRPTPAPRRSDDEATPRRSPIPMPFGAARANGAASHGPVGLPTNGVRPSRTMHGLAAAPWREPVDELAPGAPTSPVPPSSRHGGANEEPRSTSERSRADARPAAPAIRPVDPRVEAPTRPAPPPSASTASPTTPAPGPVAVDMSSRNPLREGTLDGDEPAAGEPGSDPESEQEFFEAGEDGSYARGPRGNAPVLRDERDSEEGSSSDERRATPSRHLRAQRNKVIVAAVLVLAAVPLIVGAWRHFAARGQANVGHEPSSAAAPGPLGADAVKQPGNTDHNVASNHDVASNSASVSPMGGVAADAATPIVPDGSTSLGQATESAPPTPAPVTGLASAPPATAGAPPAINAPSPRPDARAPSPNASNPSAAPRSPARSLPPSAPAPKSPGLGQNPPNSADSPFIPPFEPAPPAPQPRPGEKPPTAAYPLR
jgi:DNA-binding response OmpR family regulator